MLWRQITNPMSGATVKRRERDWRETELQSLESYHTDEGASSTFHRKLKYIWKKISGNEKKKKATER